MSCPFASEEDNENSQANKEQGPVYSSYLQLDKLLSAQVPLSCKENGRPAHDELLFITIHQVYELWFKLVIHEIDWIRECFLSEKILDDSHLLQVVRQMNRVVEIIKVCGSQMSILNTMTPLDFMDFRKSLGTSSGFQSMQFRVLENKLGIKSENRIRYAGKPYLSQLPKDEAEKVQKVEGEPSLRDVVEGWLERTPGLETHWFPEFQRNVQRHFESEHEAAKDIQDEAAREQVEAACLRNLEQFETLFDEEKHQRLVASNVRSLSYKATRGALMIFTLRDHTRFHTPFTLLSLLQDLDAHLMTWRHNHALVVQRVIGSKPGTGGSSGYQYLRSTVSDRYKVFKDLNNLASFTVPRELLPDLDQKIISELNKSYFQ
eukprot:m.334230 g.334230  ORF g.334230 m.334230 type:complete len:376 (+) comp17316_c0_seq1:268-1395(+)